MDAAKSHNDLAVYRLRYLWVGRTGSPSRDCQGQASKVLVSFPDPTNPSADCLQYRAWGGGFGDFYHVSMFSAGIRADPIVLQTVIQHHAMIQLVQYRSIKSLCSVSRKQSLYG